jgi:hypothetical protein
MAGAIEPSPQGVPWIAKVNHVLWIFMVDKYLSPSL